MDEREYEMSIFHFMNTFRTVLPLIQLNVALELRGREFTFLAVIFAYVTMVCSIRLFICTLPCCCGFFNTLTVYACTLLRSCGFLRHVYVHAPAHFERIPSRGSHFPQTYSSRFHSTKYQLNNTLILEKVLFYCFRFFVVE